jgi:hypothetical protein
LGGGGSSGNEIEMIGWVNESFEVGLVNSLSYQDSSKLFALDSVRNPTQITKVMKLKGSGYAFGSNYYRFDNFVSGEVMCTVADNPVFCDVGSGQQMNLRDSEGNFQSDNIDRGTVFAKRSGANGHLANFSGNSIFGTGHVSPRINENRNFFVGKYNDATGDVTKIQTLSILSVVNNGNNDRVRISTPANWNNVICDLGINQVCTVSGISFKLTRINVNNYGGNQAPYSVEFRLV